MYIIYTLYIYIYIIYILHMYHIYIIYTYILKLKAKNKTFWIKYCIKNIKNTFLFLIFI